MDGTRYAYGDQPQRAILRRYRCARRTAAQPHCSRAGEALYLNAGSLHAYVSGLGVEIMANSDNVLRGGLTPKFVDVPELVKVLTYESVADPRVQQVDKAGAPNVKGAEAWSYPVPIDEFALDRVELGANDEVELEFDGPAIALCTGGSVELEDTEGNTQTHSWWCRVAPRCRGCRKGARRPKRSRPALRRSRLGACA